MNVLLISANPEHLPDPVFPIGPAYLAAALRQAGIACRCLDLCFQEDPVTAIGSAIAEQPPDLVGISLRNVDNVSWPNSVSYLPYYKEVVAAVRRHTRAPIVLGGSGFTLLPQLLLDELGADYGIAGEGETALVRLACALAAGRPHPKLIEAHDNDRQDLEGLPAPDRDSFDTALYLRRGGMGSLQTKRGCPFGCIYCTYPLIEGRRVRMRSPQNVVAEIENLLARGLDTLFFVDNEFTHPPDHAEAICRRIIARGLKVNWSCYASPAGITPQLVDLMRTAGCTSLEFGTDAGCDPMLRSLGKPFDTAQVLEASAVCRRSGMPFCHALLLGGPGETPDTLVQTLETIAGTQPRAVICMAGIRIFPHTRLAALAAHEGRLQPGQGFLDPLFYLSEAVAPIILPLLQSFAQSHASWIFPGLNINMNPVLTNKLRRFGARGPLWERMKPVPGGAP